MPLLSTLPGSIDIFFILRLSQDFPDGSVVKTSPSIARRAGWITGQGANIPHASQPRNQNIKQKQICNKFNKGLKMTFPIKDLVNLFASPCKLFILSWTGTSRTMALYYGLWLYNSALHLSHFNRPQMRLYQAYGIFFRFNLFPFVIDIFPNTIWCFKQAKNLQVVHIVFYMSNWKMAKSKTQYNDLCFNNQC